MASCKWSIIGGSMWIYNSTTHNLFTWQVASGGVKVVGSCESTTLPTHNLPQEQIVAKF